MRLLRTSFEYGEAISGFSDGSEITPDDEDLTDAVTAVEETK